MDVSNPTYDVIVPGGGNGALCSALAAQEESANALVLERAPDSEPGGNHAEAIPCT
jgi:tricarballylate dehydrogenase